MIRFQTQFTANHTNVVYRVDVIDKDYSGGIGELRGTRDWLQFSHQRIDPRRYTEIQQGELRLNVFTEGNVAFRNQITSARENRFELHLYEGGVLKWKGAVLPDLCSYTEHPDERLTIVAKDFTLLKSSFFELEDERELVIDTIRKILNPLGYSIPYITSTSWTNANMNDGQDFLRQTYHETRAFRIFGDIDSEITREEALKWILRNYGLTLKQWGGFRLDQFTAQGASVFRAVYGSSGSPSSEGFVGASHTVDKITIGSSNQALPAVKRVINTFNHRSQTERPTLPRFIALQQNESDVRSFTISYTGDETLSLRARITAQSDSAFNGGQVRMTLRAGSFYWNGVRWVEQVVDFTEQLLGGDLQVEGGSRRAATGSLSIETTEVPEDNPFEITFRNAQLRLNSGDLFEADETLFDSLELELGGLADDNAITYQLVQGDTFTEELRVQETYFGDGPLKGSVSALRYSTSLDDVTQEDWRRRGTSIQRLFHSNLLHEFLDGRRGARRLLNADIIGGFQPENNLSYDGGLLYYTGGTLDGQTGRWNAQVVAISIEDLNEQVDRIASEGVGSGGFGQAVNFSLENLRRILLLAGAVGLTTEDYENETITEIALDLNQPVREGFEYWVVNSSELNARSVYDGIYPFVPDIEETSNSGEILLPIQEQLVNAPRGSLVLLAPSQAATNQTRMESISQETIGEVEANASAVFELDSRVTVNEGDISVTASALTAVESRLQDGAFEFTASAFLSLDTEVTSIDGRVTANANAILQVEADIGDNQTAIAGLQLSVGEIETDIDGIDADLGTIGARSVLFTDVNGNIASIELLSGTAGSAIDINASQVKINGVLFDDAGNIRSTNFNGTFTAGAINTFGTAGWAIDRTGTAVFNDVVIRNGEIDATTLVNLSILGTLTIGAGGSIVGNNFNFTQAGGNISGWIIDSNTLKSQASGARIELNKAENRVSIFDSVGEKAVMGYLSGLPKNSGVGNWGSNDYGFWAKNGDYLVIDGDMEYDSGDWMIQNDGSIRILDGSNKEIVRLGTQAGKKGLFMYDAAVVTSSTTESGIPYTTGNLISSFNADGFVVGNKSGNNYIEYVQSTGVLELRGKLDADDIVAGTLDVGRLDVDDILAENAEITGVLKMGASGEITNEDGDFSLSSNGLSLQEGTEGARRIEWYAGSALKADIRTVNSGTVEGVANTRSFSIQARNEFSGNMEVVANLNAQRIDFEKSVRVNGNFAFAGSNRIADLSGGQYLELPRRTTDPTGVAGRLYFNTASGTLKYHDGAGWRTLV